jgi:predicted secreted protein
MNSGLSSLTSLKLHALPLALRARTDFDNALVTLGTGVAAMMESYCGRTFLRTVNAVARFSANNLSFSLSRYPVESLTSIVLNAANGSGDTTITADVERTDLAAGLVHFASVPGTQHDQVTITFTGGYWWDTTEDASGTPPNGSAALPADLLMAFHLQVKAVCEAQNLFGTAAAGSSKDKPAASMSFDLIPAVTKILDRYRRM